MSEEGVSSFFTELMANEGLRRRFGRAGENFLSNKRSFDRNVESVLDFVNLPSKRDFRELKARLDHLNGQLTNLNIKIDRLMAGMALHRLPYQQLRAPANVRSPDQRLTRSRFQPDFTLVLRVELLNRVQKPIERLRQIPKNLNPVLMIRAVSHSDEVGARRFSRNPIGIAVAHVNRPFGGHS